MTIISDAIEKIDLAVARPASRVRFAHLDGIRGFTSLYVVLAHVGILIDQRERVWPWLNRFLDLTKGGHSAVSIFIVLSGYCLMLPVARSRDRAGDPDSTGAFLPYIGRRARRILPPYYAILILCLFVMALVPGGPGSVGNWWSTMWPAFTPSVLLSHIFLVHNVNEAWVYKIDAPMWSVATEWQIYFLFPLVLLPILRKFGAAALIVSSIVIGLAPLYFFRRFEWAAPWFSALFAIGMVAAFGLSASESRVGVLAHRVHASCKMSRWASTPTLLREWVNRLKAHPPVLPLCSALAAVTAALAIWGNHLRIYGNWKYQFVVDLTSGGAVGFFLIWAARRATEDHSSFGRSRSLMLSILTSRPALGLGAFSYSLYLTHALVLVLLHLFLSKVSLGPNSRALAMVFGGTSLSIGFAFLFYLGFEKPFLVRRRGDQAQ